MKRGKLIRSKKLVAVVMAAALCMSSGVMALADQSEGLEYEASENNDVKEDNIEGISDGGLKVSSEDGVEVGGAKAEVSVKEGVSNSQGNAIEADSKSTSNSEDSSASTDVTVNGDVNAENTTEEYASATGVKAESNTEGEKSKATTEVTVTGNVSATSNGSSKGIEAKSEGKGASSSVIVEGNVTSNSSNSGAYGIDISSKDGEVNIEVDGKLTADSSGFTFGINGNNSGDSDVDIKVIGDVSANGAGGGEAIQIISTGKSFNVEVGGSVKQTGSGEEAMGIHIMDSGYIPEENQGTPTIKVTVAKDVSSDGNAISVSKNAEDSTIDVLVGGTVSGKDHNIVLMGEGTSEKLDITVWKVDISNNKNVVDSFDDNYNLTKNEAAEKTINYIIKADSTEAKIAMSGQGEQRSDGTYVAKEGKEVYFSVDIPNGYTAEFYDVNDNTAYQIIPNGTGGAYISVPRGGGVYVGVRLTKTSTAESNSGSTKESSSANTVTIVNSESRSESGASDGEYWSPSSNNQANALGGVFSGYETLQALQIPSAIYGGPDMFVNVADVLTPVDTITAMNSFTGTDRASINTNNVMGAGIVDFKNMFVNASSNTVEVPVPANVVANQSYTVMFSDGTSIVVPCAMNGVLSIPFSKTAEGLTYIICGIQLDPSMFIGMPPATGWTY